MSDAETGDAGFLSEAVGGGGEVGELVLGLSATDTCTDDGVMGFRRGGAGKRRDANEPSLIAGWRAVGAKVWQVGGTGLPDVIVLFRGKWHCFEIKTATGTLTDAQGEFPVVRDRDEALRAIGALR